MYIAMHPVELPATLFLNLELHLWETRPEVKPKDFIKELVERWLAADIARRRQNKNETLRGYQWKTVFLPEGTALRTSRDGNQAFAAVSGDCIVHEGQRTSPSQFANGDGRGRNAWRAVWLRFPGDEHWQRAADCRARHARRVQKRANCVYEAG